MQIAGHPFLLQSMGFESYAEPVFVTVPVRTEQFHTAKALLAGNGRAKCPGVGLFHGLLGTWFDFHINEQDEHRHLTISV
jgi:hypothetical protein